MEDRVVIWRETELGHGRYRHTLIDGETGEILKELYDCASLEYVYESVANTVMLGHGIAIGKEKAEGSREYITITDHGGKKPKVMFSFWNNPIKHKRKGIKPQSSGNKKQYLKLYTEKLSKLEPMLAGMLVKLAKESDWETGKLKLVAVDDIIKRVGCSKSTLYEYIEKLQQKDAIVKQNNGEYVINREYIAKG